MYMQPQLFHLIIITLKHLIHCVIVIRKDALLSLDLISIDKPTCIHTYVYIYVCINIRVYILRKIVCT